MLELTLKTCKENITGFGFSCNNTGVAGEVKTGSMVTHLIYLEHLPNTTAGIKITLPAAGVTFNCAGFSRKLVTGKVIGHISNPNCGTFQLSHTADFVEKTGANGMAMVGHQRWMQATTTGATTDLISSNDTGGAYTTTALIGTTVIDWNGANRVKLTC